MQDADHHSSSVASADDLAAALQLGAATSIDRCAERALEWLHERLGIRDAVILSGEHVPFRVAAARGNELATEEAVARSRRTVLPAVVNGVCAAPMRAQDALVGVIAARCDEQAMPKLVLAGNLLGVLAHSLQRWNVDPASDEDALEASAPILGDSPCMEEAITQARLVASTESTVLVLGESGTGKELISTLIHAQSRRARRPLVTANCASIPESLFESEFFGHVKGAFTGAHENRAGRFAAANGGTLFLDEVGEIPLGLQSKLLRVLQQGTFERVGDSVTQRVDVRIVAATNRDLLTEVKQGRFREDLYYRLSVFPVELPPLRDRGDDVMLLADRFIARCARRQGKPEPVLTPAAIESLRRHRWPGNVRELVNVIERAVILATGGAIHPEHLSLRASEETRTADAAPDRVLTYDELRDMERANVQLAMERCAGQVGGRGGAAELVGLAPSTLSSKLRALGLK